MSDIANQETCLYRHYDANGVLLYVGISQNAAARLAAHKIHSVWFSKITSVKIERLPNRTAAIIEEARVIKEEKPVHNVKHNFSGKTEFEEFEDKFMSSAIVRDEEELTHEVVRLHPIYGMSDAAQFLGVGSSYMRQLIETKMISAIQVSSSQRKDRNGKLKTFKKYVVSGWALLDYIQACEEANRKAQ